MRGKKHIMLKKTDASLQDLPIDMDYVSHSLLSLLNTPSPTGYTDQIVHDVCAELTALGIRHEITRRGAIRANLPGGSSAPERAIVSHLDTLGAMVTEVKQNGRLAVCPIGTWSSRFAEGARVNIYTDNAPFRGTIVPLKASGHVYNEEVDTQPVSWDTVEVRVDEVAATGEDLFHLGFRIGDFVAVDPQPELLENGYINARHLDDKAGVAAMLGAAKAVVDAGVELPLPCHLLFTISEEVGSGASGVLHGDVAEMLTVDNGTVAPGQGSREFGVTVAMADSSGPFDYHLSHKLIGLCLDHAIAFQRDVFKHYRSDSASAIEAGNDIRTALVCFGLDASHGYERTNMNAIESVARLLALYMQSGPTVKRDRRALAPLDADFSEQPTEGVPIKHPAGD